MLKKILVIVVLAIVAFVIVVALQPSEFRISRSTTIDAPPPEIFPDINDLHNWNDWSPWAKLDPDAENSFEGAESGEGAVFQWSGNDQIGAGSMTITESDPDELVHYKLAFERPMESVADAEFQLEPLGEDQTKVTWTMTGHNDFMGKAVCLFMDMDAMVGKDFDQGLANLKEKVEAEYQKETADKQEKEEEAEPPAAAEQ